MSFVVDMIIRAYHLAVLINLPVFLVFGVYSLHRRFKREQEWHTPVQALVLAFAVCCCALEIVSLRYVLREGTVYFVFSSLGMLMATAALYGHLAVSLAARLLTELVTPGGDSGADLPRMGPAEAHERMGRHDLALNEYLMLAKIYPDRPQILLRVAENLAKTGRAGEALAWYQRALPKLTNPAAQFSVVRRLWEIHASFLDQPEAARRVVEEFCARFPQSREARDAERLLENIPRPEHPPVDVEKEELVLERLEDHPLNESGEEGKKPE